MLGKSCVFGYIRWARECPKHLWLVFVWEVCFFCFLPFVFVTQGLTLLIANLGNSPISAFECWDFRSVPPHRAWCLWLREAYSSGSKGGEENIKIKAHIVFLFFDLLVDKWNKSTGSENASDHKWGFQGRLEEVSMPNTDVCLCRKNALHFWKPVLHLSIWNNISSLGALCMFPSLSH